MKCLHLLFSNEVELCHMRCILINEYAADEINRTTSISDLYPHLEIIQKEKKDIGQTASINMILNILRQNTYEFWIHWEESWMLQSAFVRDSMYILQKYPEISQLQIAKGWDDVPHDKHEMVNIVSHEYHILLDTVLGTVVGSKWKHKPWPLFSLQPGIDRVKNVIDIDDFHARHNSVPNGKVNGSEFHFAHRWYLQKYKKGILTPFRSLRDITHISTSHYIKD
jgi:hypothetical protein